MRSIPAAPLKKIKLIQDEDGAPVIVRYCGPDGNDKTIDKWLNALKKDGPDRWLMRKLQRYTVTIPRRDAMRLLAQNDVEEVIPGLFAQANYLLYGNQLGLSSTGFYLLPWTSSNSVPRCRCGGDRARCVERSRQNPSN